MKKNTRLFAEREIANLITKTKDNESEEKKILRFNLVFCGGFDNLPSELGNPVEFIMNNKERIIAIYKYVQSREERKYFIGFEQTEMINHYGFVFIKLDQLLELLAEHDIEYKVDETIDRYTPSYCRDDSETKIIISYNPKKEIKEEGPKLAKTKKEVN